MSTFEQNLHIALRDLADQVGTQPALRLAGPPTPTRRRAGPVLAVAAVVVAAMVVAGSVVALRTDRSGILEPVHQPPRVVRLAGTSSAAPGPALLAVTLSGGAISAGDLVHLGSQTVYLLRAGTNRAVRLTEPVGEHYFRQQLASDGEHLLLEMDPYLAAQDSTANGRLIVLDLRSGQSAGIGQVRGLCPELAPDAGSVAFHENSAVVTLDPRTGARTTVVTGQRPVPDNEVGCAGGLGWSPDGQLLAVGRLSHRGNPWTTRVFRLSGSPVVTLPGHLVNGSMSWSPDGGSVLLYDEPAGTFRVGSSDGSVSVVARPPDAFSAVGWAGSRIVWLAGTAGHQRLVTTDRAGGDVRDWLRFAVGARQVVSVQWSRGLGGTAAR